MAGEIQVAEADGRFLAGSPSPPSTPASVSKTPLPAPPRRLWRLKSSMYEPESKRRRVESPAAPAASPRDALKISTPRASGRDSSEKFDNVYHQIFVCR